MADDARILFYTQVRITLPEANDLVGYIAPPRAEEKLRDDQYVVDAYGDGRFIVAAKDLEVLKPVGG